MLQALIALRQQLIALRYGRYYIRSISGDGHGFGHSMDKGGVFAMSRVHCDQEVLVIAYPNPFQDWSGSVEVDSDLSADGEAWKIAFSTLGNGGNSIASSPGGVSRAIPVTLKSNELQIWTRA